ncbi:MAG: AAA family ATPase [Planctomycetaceae bacterium]|nr:AAA family ATPase [Planctomycetaceae bacterium]
MPQPLVESPHMISPEIASLFNEIQANYGTPKEAKKPKAPTQPKPTKTEFAPVEPTTLQQSGLAEHQVDALILKYLLNCGVASGRDIASQVKLPFGIVGELLRKMKASQLVFYRQTCGVNDFEYELTPAGEERASRLFDRNTYFGSAPVSLEDYSKSVSAQSPIHEAPSADALKSALADLQVDPSLFTQLGQALMSVAAMFLYGKPGNGKTSIAERLTGAFGPSIWVPRAIHVDREIVRVFDPTMHEELRMPQTTPLGKVDQRWVLIKRPTIIVGGELTMESLEMRKDRSTGVLEAPVQLKSNGGTLVIDDFGRQRVSTDELLNRWIIPLEKHYDFLNTPTGKKVKVPFEQLVVFATNLEPRDLVDEAFLRRIPYKIEALDPSEEDLLGLFHKLAPKFEIPLNQEILDYLFTKHYREADRSLRYCHARDLLNQISNYQRFHNLEGIPTKEAIDAAVKNYFSVM